LPYTTLFRSAANIIETGLENLTEEFVDACRSRGMKIMVYHTEKDPVAFRTILDWGVDLINCDHGDVVAQVAAAHAAERAPGER